MIDVLTAADVRRQDAAAAARGVPVATLMERAGSAVARAARAMLGGVYGRRIVVVCGKGNNAGDGLVAARLLHADGAHVTVALAADPDALSELAAAKLARFRGVVVGLDRLARARDAADLIIDAVFGVGLTRAPDGAYADAIAATAHTSVLAIDVPSGVDADTGAIPGVAVRARATVALGGPKPGLLFQPGAAHAGEVTVVDIGAGPSDGSIRCLERADVAAAWPVRAPGTNKRRVGTVLVVAGSRAMPGAAALATRACVHGGAGLTMLCAPEEAAAAAIGAAPEITTIPAPSTGDGTIDPKALDAIRPRLDEFHAIAIGPGLSTHPAAMETVRALVAEATVPVVLDADALSAFAGAAGPLAARSAPTIITPHAGELGRLLGRENLDVDRLAAARDAVERFGATVIFKGPGTVIADAEAIFIDPIGGAMLSQGGTGDVLTGLTAALVAQRAVRGLPVDAQAVAAAVWVHSRAAARIAARLAPHPANASALIDEIGPTLHEVFHG